MISILIADDHPLMIEGIKASLAGEEDIEVLAEAADFEVRTLLGRNRDRAERVVLLVAEAVPHGYQYAAHGWTGMY